jgi:multicomponent Na+:H+ antiporter subunit B
MSEIVKNTVRIFAGFTLLFGVYIVAYGHITPGGGFAGGVLIAGSFILLTLAYGKKLALQKLSRSMSSTLDSLGALIFLFLALVGIAGGYFFLNFLPRGKPFQLFSAGIIPLCNIAIGLKVGASLFAVFIALAMVRIVKREDGTTDYLEETDDTETEQ